MEILYAVIGLAVGALVGYLLTRVASNKQQSEIEVLKSRLNDSKAMAESSLRQLEEAHAKTIEREQTNHAEALRREQESHAEAINRQKESHAEALEVLQGRFDETVAKMKAEIESLTDKMLKDRQKEFELSSRQSVSRILQPLNESITEMRKAVDENTVKHTEFGGKLSENIRSVIEQSEAARKSADRLANALSGSNRVQGEWGETLLTEILESQGLTEGIHFETQSVIRDSAGNVVRTETENSMRPDVILHLDKDRDVVIDSKVSLSAYLDYMQADTEEKRSVALQAHVRSIEKHVAELERKDYSSYLRKKGAGIDYVIMFVPNSSALYAATNQRPELWRKAMEKGVYIADEQTLYAALKIIALTWRQIQQAENHEKVYKLADEMLDRVSAFMQKFTAVGEKLNDARTCYEDAFAKLRDSGQSIPVTCGKLVKMGAKAKPRKGVAPELVGMAEEKALEA